ncbi:hypothetical protein D3C81_1331420 [compost metagenome]
MKAVPKVNTDGLYIEDTLVDDAFNGVVPFYDSEMILLLETDSTDNQERKGVDESEPAGYIVGVPVPQGLFHPRFDLVAWEAREKGDTSDQSSYWIEGLTSQEIEELTRARPQEPSELERLQMELTNTQVALTDTYELLLAFQEELASLKGGLSNGPNLRSINP